VVGLHKLLESELSLRLKDEERATLVRDNTRKLYMAMTRAGQRLVMTCVGDARALFPIPLQGDLP
jgi:ATP-dependent exoDNAse (exonuclease V) beta subunit